MNTSGKYVFDSSNLIAKSYELLCIFFSAKELTRRTNPYNDDSAISFLRNRFFESTVTRLLIEIAASLRVIDDQMRQLPKDSQERNEYENRLEAIDQYEFQVFNEELTLRTVCNKIIHADTFEILLKDSTEAHEYDSAYIHGDSEQEIFWKYPSGHVKLSGKQNWKKDDWTIQLDIEIFVAAVVDLLRD